MIIGFFVLVIFFFIIVSFMFLGFVYVFFVGFGGFGWRKYSVIFCLWWLILIFIDGIFFFIRNCNEIFLKGSLL